MLPVMYPMCVNVKNEMLKSPKIQNALMKSNLDDIVTAWTGMFLHSVYHIFKDLRRKGNIKWTIHYYFVDFHHRRRNWIG